MHSCRRYIVVNSRRVVGDGVGIGFVDVECGAASVIARRWRGVVALLRH